MRVLHLIKGLGPGGAEQLLVNQAGVRTPEFEFAAAYLVPAKAHHVDALVAEGWDVTCLASARAWDLRWVRRFRRLISGGEIDVVHGHSPLVSAFARLVAATVPTRRRPRLVYTEHNEWGRHRGWTRRLNRWTIHLEDRVLAVSAGVRASMPADLDVTVVHHGIDVEAVRASRGERDAVRAELGLPADAIVIGIVANLRREKAYEVLFDAAVMVTDSNADVVFVAVGQGPLEDELTARHDALGLGERFRFLGYRSDAVRVMTGYDIFVLSSRHEGLPVALMEAMVLDLPVVATRVGGIPEATAGTDARLVEPDDPAALAAACFSVVADLSERPGSATTRFDIAATVEILLAIYRGLDSAGD